jgi:hypothetical protein
MSTPLFVTAQVLHINGGAWLQEGDTAVPVHVGTVLQEGAQLQTGPQSALVLQLASGHELGLGSGQSLLLDADVLATLQADAGEWALDGHANAAMVVEWLAPAESPLPLSAVIEAPGENLDQLLQGSAPVTADSAQMHQLMLAGIHDDGLACLLRSLYGPEAG